MSSLWHYYCDGCEMRESFDRVPSDSHRICVRCWCTCDTLDGFRHISYAGIYREKKKSLNEPPCPSRLEMIGNDRLTCKSDNPYELWEHSRAWISWSAASISGFAEPRRSFFQPVAPAADRLSRRASGIYR